MQLPLDLRVVGFTAAVGLLTTVCCGLLPALRATRLDLNMEFHDGTRGLGGGALSRLGQKLGVALVACWLPARRATRVDPMVSLRSD